MRWLLANDDRGWFCIFGQKLGSFSFKLLQNVSKVSLNKKLDQFQESLTICLAYFYLLNTFIFMRNSTKLVPQIQNQQQKKIELCQKNPYNLLQLLHSCCPWRRIEDFKNHPHQSNIIKSLNTNLDAEPKQAIINVPHQRQRLDLDVEDHQNIKNVFGNMIKKSYPASVTWATFHRNICKYGHNISIIASNKDQQSKEEAPVCPCCNNSIIFQQLPLCYDTSIPQQIKQGQERHQLSSGICLFFLFIKLCIYYLLLRTLICDGFNLYTSIHGSYCTQNPSKCSNYFNSFLSGYNKHHINDQQALMVLDIFNLVLVIVSIIYFTYVHIYFNRIHLFLDHVNVTDDDFSLMVENIPSVIRGKNVRSLENFQYKESSLEVSIQEELRIAFREFFQEIQYKKEIYAENGIFIDSRTPTIVNISLCYDLSQFENLNKIQKDLYEDFFIDQLTTKALQTYQKQMKERKEQIRNNNETNKALKLEQRQTIVANKQFQAQAQGISQIFSNNFKYRLKGVQINEREILSGSQANQNIHILKFLNFLSKFDNLTINARQKYLTKDIIKTNHSHFIGKALITFEHQQTLDMFLEVYQKVPQIFKIDNKQLKITEATQPQDILWQNLKYTKQQRSQSYMFSNLILFMCVGFSFLFSLLAQQWQVSSTKRIQRNQMTPISHHLTRHFMEENTSLLLPDQQLATQNPQDRLLQKGGDITLKLGLNVFTDEQVSNYFNNFMVILTSVINVLLQIIIRKLTELQKYKTKTQKIKMMIKRFVFSKFINTCIIYFILYIINLKVDILSQNGLMNKVIKLVSLGAAIDISINIFLPSKTIKFIYYSYLYKNISYANTTQQELNQQMAYPQFDFVQRYSYYIVQIYLISFYSYLCPIATILLIAIFIIQYWIDKIHLFKWCTVNNSMGYMLSEEVLKYLESSILVCTVGNIFFYQIINVYQQFSFTALNFLTFFISLLYVIFVFTGPYSVKKVLYRIQNYTLKKTYSQCFKQKMLKSTYRSQNPATSEGLKQRESSLNRSPLADGLRLSYESYRLFEQFLGIFLPDQIQKYFRWQEKYVKVIDKYGSGDQQLFDQCFQIRRQSNNQCCFKQQQ